MDKTKIADLELDKWICIQLWDRFNVGNMYRNRTAHQENYQYSTLIITFNPVKDFLHQYESMNKINQKNKMSCKRSRGYDLLSMSGTLAILERLSYSISCNCWVHYKWGESLDGCSESLLSSSYSLRPHCQPSILLAGKWIAMHEIVL